MVATIGLGIAWAELVESVYDRAYQKVPDLEPVGVVDCVTDKA